MSTLSVCIPTYNRSEDLQKLLESMSEYTKELEVIIVDDGSTDKTKDVVEKFKSTSNFKVIYNWHPNCGRAISLLKALEIASGDYTMIMDSDDFFLPGWSVTVVDGLKRIIGTKTTGLIYNTVNEQMQIIGAPFPRDELRVNLIKLRADFNVAGDKKEILQTKVIKNSLYKVHNGERRVPTAILWARAASFGDCMCISKEIVVKNYKSDGLTKNIENLKFKNPYSMAELNEIYAFCKLYESRAFRIKAYILYAKYSILSRRKMKLTPMVALLLPIGAYLALYAYFKILKSKIWSTSRA